MTGVEFGRTILEYIPNSPMPSTLAASRYSVGNVIRYCLIWNTPKALTKNGMIRPGIVLMIFIFVATR